MTFLERHLAIYNMLRGKIMHKNVYCSNKKRVNNQNVHLVDELINNIFISETMKYYAGIKNVGLASCSKNIGLYLLE